MREMGAEEGVEGGARGKRREVVGADGGEERRCIAVHCMTKPCHYETSNHSLPHELESE